MICLSKSERLQMLMNVRKASKCILTKLSYNIFIIYYLSTYQARTTKEAGKMQMKRAALVKAGLALAPDSFGLVMDGENGLSLPRGGPSNKHQLGSKVDRYRKSMSVITGHIDRLGNENDRER